MKIAFPKSFDHVGNMPGAYTIHLDPSVPPAQHARRKAPIEYKEQIKKALQQMKDLKIITLVTIQQNGSHQSHTLENQMELYAYV